MTFQEIQDELCRLEAALQERGAKASIYMKIKTGRSSVYMIENYSTSKNIFGGKDCEVVFGDTPKVMFDEAWAVIRALPDPDIAARRNWQAKLADVIDEGHALNLPDEVMTPIRAGSQAMTENLLTYEADQ